MPYRSTLISIAAMITAAIFIFYLFQERVAGLWLQLAVHPDIQATLAEAAEDQKSLAKLDSNQAETYRNRFDQIQAIRNHLFILESNGREVVGRSQRLLLGLLILILLATFALQFLTHRRIGKRIAELRVPLEDLAEGRKTLHLPTPSNDTIGRVAAMIAQTGRVMADQREKLAYLQHLSGWQEASRRHAHEIRTPLTAARLETQRLETAIQNGAPETIQAIRTGTHSILEELDRIKKFAQDFTAFARMRQPQREPVHLHDFMAQFCELFANGWKALALVNRSPKEAPPPVQMDREMIRQVLVNLVNNSAKALDGKSGTVIFEFSQTETEVILAITDSGPGIPQSMIDRLFEPYATTSKVGEGMGLGLAIARKIMLDHGGELRLHTSGDEGTCFHLVLPKFIDLETQAVSAQ